jgi:hypothetical protein
LRGYLIFLLINSFGIYRADYKVLARDIKSKRKIRVEDLLNKYKDFQKGCFRKLCKYVS